MVKWLTVLGSMIIKEEMVVQGGRLLQLKTMNLKDFHLKGCVMGK